MSQTVTNRPSQLTIQTVKDQTTLETLHRASSTDDSSATKSRLGVSDTENQSSLSTEGPEEWTNGDIKELESVERQLSRETVHKHDYHRELERIQESMKSTMASKLPASLKVTMMESLMEKLRTNMNCVREANRVMKENMARDSNQQRSASSSPSRRLGTGKQGVKVEEVRESPVKGEGEETVEEVKKEIKKLEETIAQMKQTRNSLTMALEDKADSIEDIQALLKEKKQTLDRKTIMVENMKLKISSTSDKKTSGRSGGATHRKTNSEMGLFSLKNYLKKSTSKNDNDKTVDMSTSRLETSVLKEMSSKIGNVFGKMGRVFGKKDGKMSDQILNTEFLRELENQSTPASLNNSLVECGRRDMNLSISNFNFK